MSPSAARARIAALAWQAIRLEEHDDLVDALGAPVTHRPARCRDTSDTTNKGMKE